MSNISYSKLTIQFQKQIGIQFKNPLLLEEALRHSSFKSSTSPQFNNERLEFTQADYDQAIIDRKNSILDEYNNGYIRARQEQYLPIPEQLDLLYWDVYKLRPKIRNGAYTRYRYGR